jgi:hypothetical protein
MMGDDTVGDECEPEALDVAAKWFTRGNTHYHSLLALCLQHQAHLDPPGCSCLQQEEFLQGAFDVQDF